MMQARSLVTAGVVLLLSLTFTASSQALTVNYYLTQAAFNGAATTVLWEDFESFPAKDALLTSFTRDGVTYTGLAGSPFPNLVVSSPGYTNFGAGVPQPTTTSILVANGDEDILMDFSMTPLAVGFDVYFNGLGDVTTTVTTTGGTFTLVDLRNLDNVGFYGFVSSDPITSIEFKSTLGGRLNTGVDNIEISAPVPEPTSLGLLGAGLVALRARRRRSTQAD